MDLVVDSELLQPNQAVKTVFVHCTWYRRCLLTPHIIFNQIHDVEFLALFEHFAWFPNNVRRAAVQPAEEHRPFGVCTNTALEG